ncbi:MAG: hypothetical protein HY903_07295 [Deltaproteobacteria bacterium]|nr:hypothetical protein [Deltaproteobacteria bacterium]
MSSLSYHVATAPDDEALRRLWRETPMPGRIALAFEREPSIFLAAGLQGDVHQTLVAIDAESGRAVGSAGRAELQAYVNGQVTTLGYLSELRVHPERRWHRTLLTDGWAHFREMHERGAAKLYVTTVFADNIAAHRLLTRNRPGWPVYRARERVTTLAVVLPRAKKVRCPVAGVELRRARVEDVDAIADCLQRVYARQQLAPYWRVADLQSAVRCRGLAVEDFTVATRGGRVVGSVAVWDQQAFKQTRIHGYSGTMRWLRHGWNLAAPLWRRPPLPEPGQLLPHAFLSHIAVEDQDPALFVALAKTALAAVHDRRYAYVTFTLSEHSPLLVAARRCFRSMAYDSILYLVHVGDGADAVAGVDSRPAHLEAAIL